MLFPSFFVFPNSFLVCSIFLVSVGWRSTGPCSFTPMALPLSRVLPFDAAFAPPRWRCPPCIAPIASALPWCGQRCQGGVDTL
uniref:Secreted protein n=1 Tax=Arundo donax TaxID=35708 RepID=A0A0A9CPL6_ARUDO